MDLTVTRTVEGERALLRADGSIDAASRNRLATAATEVVDGGATTVVVDLSGVTFMDSTGIGTLVEIANQLDDADGTFYVREPSRPVARLLEVSGLSDAWREGPVD